MSELSKRGTIERRRKGGTHVLSHPVTRAIIDIPIIRKEIEADGKTYGYQLISRTLTECPAEIAAKLNLAKPRTMLHVEALHLADQHPYAFEDRWISVDTVPEILNVDLTRQNANEWLVQNRPYSRCDLLFHAQNARATDADLLSTDLNAALLVIERTTWIGTDPITAVKVVTSPGYKVASN